MGRRIAAKITGVAGYVPPRLVTNFDLEKITDTTDEWIRTRTGIIERHYADPGMASSHLGTEAARKLLEAKGIPAEEIEMIVLATVTPDMLFPSTACLIQDRLGASKAWGFDLSAACSGFVYALTVGAQFVGAGSHKKVLVIGSDVMTSILDFKDRATCVLFGDGAGAVLVEPAASDSEGIIDFVNDVDGSGGCNLYMPAGGSLHPSSQETVEKRMHYVHQEGAQVFKYAVRRMSELAVEILERNGLTSRDLTLVVPHQANLRIIRAMQERLGVDDSKILINIDHFGNTTAATIPLGLMDALEQKRLRKGDLVLLISVGAGYTTGAMLLRWAY
ncbi:MAG TPA: beta-ketoacyl-ACP synthase III [Candidatus Dormibacteraeota bacterium]|jgi:3-oxoacyl-[acyl-carrier-protein] synthase-3|nr:beta-ketoacyl-ACP synthase III [Candidatus Dormibacteraeota bacterium]